MNKQEIPLRISTNEAIQKHLEPQIAERLYDYGDLDPKYNAEYFGFVEEDGDVRTVGLLFRPLRVLLLMGTSKEDIKLAKAVHWYDGIDHGEYEVHLSYSSLEALREVDWKLTAVSPHYRMVLPKSAQLQIETGALLQSGICEVHIDDSSEVSTFLDRVYPAHAFMPETLKEFPIIALRGDDGSIHATAGTHIFSQTQECAAIGNVAVDPIHRGKGLGEKVVAALLAKLAQEGIKHIGLNVEKKNIAAVRLYTKLHFEVVCEYVEGRASISAP